MNIHIKKFGMICASALMVLSLGSGISAIPSSAKRAHHHRYSRYVPKRRITYKRNKGHKSRSYRRNNVKKSKKIRAEHFRKRRAHKSSGKKVYLHGVYVGTQNKGGDEDGEVDIYSGKGRYHADSVINARDIDKLDSDNKADHGDIKLNSLTEVPKESARKLKSYPSNSNKYPQNSDYYSNAGDTLSSVISHGSDLVYIDGATNSSHNYVQSYIDGINEYSPMSFDKDFQNAYISHNFQRNMKVNNYNIYNSSASPETLIKSMKKDNYYESREALIKLQHYATSKNNIYKGGFIDGADNCYNPSAFKRYYKYVQQGTNSKRNSYAYGNGLYDGYLFVNYGSGTVDAYDSPGSLVSGKFDNNAIWTQEADPSTKDYQK